MYYISGGKVYRKEAGGYRPVGIAAKNRVTVTRELERVTVTPGGGTLRKLKNPVPATLEEIIRKFHISEEHPLPLEQA